MAVLTTENQKKADAVHGGRKGFTSELTDREYVQIQVNQLKLNRVSYEPGMRQIADQLLPYRPRLQLSDYNRGDRRNARMYDSTMAFAVETLENGWLSAASDAATEWFTLTHPDPDLADWGPHRQWYDNTTRTLLDMLADSNAYVTLASFFGNTAGFGTGAFTLEESFRGSAVNTDVINTGSYWLGVDEENNVNRFHEELRMTVRQVYDWFGGTAEFSPLMQNLTDHARWEQWIDIGHMIQPNSYYNPGLKFAGNKPYSSWWFEIGSTESSGQYGYVDPIVSQNVFLRKGGFDTFPIIVGRYEMMRGEAYGVDCPGMKALGDMSALQVYEKRIAAGLEKIINPHWLAPSGLVGQADHGFTPGLTTYMPSGEGGEVKPAHMVPPGFMDPATQKQNEIRGRIGKAFSTDLFQLFDSLPDKERTATEIMQRKSEKLSKLGKPYANYQHYTFKPLIGRLYQIALKRGLIKPAPLRIQGEVISYKFNGILAQAQKMAKFTPMSTMLQEVETIAAATGGPQSPAFDVFNSDKFLYRTADALQLPADIMNSPEQVAQIRQQRQQAQAMQQKLMALESASKSAKNLGQAPTQGGESNALDDVRDAMGGGQNGQAA